MADFLRESGPPQAESSLKEQVARRLRQLDGGIDNCPDSTGARQTMALVVADEVLRLMEWARQQCLDIAGDGPEPGGHNCDEHCHWRMSKLALTLPRDDWRPE